MDEPFGATPRGILVLSTSVAESDGIGVFTHQITSGLARVFPGVAGTLITLTITGIDGVPPQWRYRSVASRLRYGLVVLWTALRQRPDEIVVTHLSVSPVAIVAARLCKARVTLIGHGVELIEVPRRRERWAVSRVHAVAANSVVTAMTVERLLHSSRRRRCGAVRRLHPTWDEKRFGPPDRTRRAQARRLFGLDDGATVLLTVGRLNSLERSKGHDRMMEALPELRSRLPHVCYVIVGAGDDRERLEELAVVRGVADAVHFTGFIDDTAMAYAAADLFVLPSTGEGFGIVLLEAIASGLPVVASGVDGCLAALDFGSLGYLCDALSSESITEAISEALAAREPGDPRADAHRRRIEAVRLFGADAFDRRLVRLFGDAADVYDFGRSFV